MTFFCFSHYTEAIVVHVQFSFSFRLHPFCYSNSRNNPASASLLCGDQSSQPPIQFHWPVLKMQWGMHNGLIQQNNTLVLLSTMNDYSRCTAFSLGDRVTQRVVYYRPQLGSLKFLQLKHLFFAHHTVPLMPPFILPFLPLIETVESVPSLVKSFDLP